AESLESIGPFPTGPDFIAYDPPSVIISSPLSDGVLPEDTENILVEGIIDKKQNEIIEVYVNGQLLDENEFDPQSGEFHKSVPLDNSDKPFFSINVKTVYDEKHRLIVKQRRVILLGEANQIGELLTDAVILHGNHDFITNIIDLAFSVLEGENIALRLSDSIDFPLGGIDFSLQPRTVMFQGIKLYQPDEESPGCRIEEISAAEGGGYRIITDVSFNKTIMEFSNASSPLPVGRNFINVQAKDIILLNGLVLTLRINADNELDVLASIDENVVIQEGPNYEAWVDTPLIETTNIILGFIFDFIEFIFEAILQFPIGDLFAPLGFNINILDLLLSQDAFTSTISEFNFTELIIDVDTEDSIEIVADAGFNPVEGQIFTASYATPDNNNKPEFIPIGTTNSVVVLSDDYFNQLIAQYLAASFGQGANASIDFDLNDLMDEFGIEAWSWLKMLSQEPNAYPRMKINLAINTAPLVEQKNESETVIGVLHLRDIRIDFVVFDEVNTPDPESDTREVCLFSGSFDRDMEIIWSNEDITFQFYRPQPYIDYNYEILFNRLDPLVFPEQISNFEDLIASVLNQGIAKFALVGIALDNLNFETDGYISIETDISSEKDLDQMIQTELAEILADQEMWSASFDYMAIADEATQAFAINPIDPENYANVVYAGPGTTNPEETEVYFRVSEYQTDGNDRLNWFASVFLNVTAPESHVITGISIDPSLIYDFYIDLLGQPFYFDPEYYEEFALVCVIRSGLPMEDLVDNNHENILGDSWPLGRIPRPEIAIPLEIDYADQALLEFPLELPPCKNVGIGLRLRKAPSALLTSELFKIEMEAFARNITVYTADMNIDVSLD
ncbi:MAG: hypothetical protein JW920_11305, partial [Deltaproteobacteria bacterium]|nr:hypothetical protein [Deltaproteobacteria bacterium]